MPEEYDLTLLDPDNKLGRDIAIMRAEMEELHAKLARMPAVIARAALGIIFCTAVITTLLSWWFLPR
jgi:NhaP-type Na+/H+ or K+/H+ antiporter